MAGTLTLSAVEQATVMVHLEDRHKGLDPSDPDSGTIHRLLVRIGEGRTISLTMLDIFALIRHLRQSHQKLDIDMMALEERRLRGGHNGQLDAAHRILDTEAECLNDVLKRLWTML